MGGEYLVCHAPLWFLTPVTDGAVRGVLRRSDGRLGSRVRERGGGPATHRRIAELAPQPALRT